MKKIFLLPGRLACSSEETQITTILGSCVAVALFDPRSKVGGLNHFLLPQLPADEAPSPRYGSYAIPALIKQLLKSGANQKSIQAKVFGGANAMAHLSINVGAKNIDLALKILDEHNIPIVEKNVGGKIGRKIWFNTNTFQVRHEFNKVQNKDGGMDTTGYIRLQVAQKVKVLIVDDSATIRHLFQKMFTKHGLQVVGVAASAYEARELIVKTKPDVITLDIEMPNMSGVAFLEKLMIHLPTPVVMISSLDSQGHAALKALDLGAVDFIQKPSQHNIADLSELGEVVVEKIRAAASVNVLQKIKRQPHVSNANEMDQNFSPAPQLNKSAIRAICVGGNTGSQDSLRLLLTSLAEDSPPIIVSNSLLSGFLKNFLDQLKGQVKVELKIAKHGDYIRSGSVYFAPSDYHTEIKASISQLSINLVQGNPVCNQIPSIDVLFHSTALTCGSACIGILLSGFGSDGVGGMEKIQAKGGFTLVQDPGEAKFPYIPQNAIARGIVQSILPVNQIANAIMRWRSIRAA